MILWFKLLLINKNTILVLFVYCHIIVLQVGQQCPLSKQNALPERPQDSYNIVHS